ncbi:ABC transporter [Corynebacterium phocae]|uniref:ABC transporter n=1 Tax=Corynebacterium phocae TaxID=161895 RepID=A0A1L7D6X9_9CORY|nr:ABC transporter [Corynebacterium phocae]
MKNTPALNFRLEPGLTHGLVGKNGIGKTTLLRMIAGQLDSSGLSVFGQDPFDNRAVMDRTILMGIDAPLVDSWSMKQLLTIGRTRWATWDEARAEELIARFNLPNKKYSALSRGQKSALGITLAFASGCELVLLDEPYLGLDISSREEFYRVLREEQGRRTIVISTHHLDELAGHLDTVLLLGEHPLSGRVDDLLDAVIEVKGPAEKMAQLKGVAILSRESTPLGERILADARPDRATAIFAQAAELGLTASEVSLERAILALEAFSPTEQEVNGSD